MPSQPQLPPTARHALPVERPKLSLLDATGIMVGIIIGASIYQSSDEIAEGARHGGLQLAQWVLGTESAELSAGAATTIGTLSLLAVWLTGGLVALVGSLCYAELSTRFPREGGNYSFLNEAFGRYVGFAFAWVEFWIVRPGNVGAMAFIFASYAAQLLAPIHAGLASTGAQLTFACAAVAGLSAVNLLGVRAGTRTQNLLTSGKVIGLLVIVATGLSLIGTPLEPAPVSERGGFQPGFALALIFVMFAYGGWSDMSYVAAEVRDPMRNISRSLVLGCVTVTAIYLAVTLAFVAGLSLDGLRNSSAAAADTMARRFGSQGAVAISLLICVSTLSAINGMLFAGGRVFYGLGQEDAAFAWLGRWNERLGGPVRSLLVQSLTTIGLIIAFGRAPGGFERLVVFTGPFFFSFLLLIVIGFFVLRGRGQIPAEGGYRVPLYPLPPLLLGAAAVLMTWKGAEHLVSELEVPANQSGGWWALYVVVTGLGVLMARWSFDRESRR